MGRKLSVTDQAILDYIGTMQDLYAGYTPSVRSIGAAIGLSSSSSVQKHLRRLERDGYIARDPSRRSIQLAREKPAHLS